MASQREMKKEESHEDSSDLSCWSEVQSQNELKDKV